MLLIFVSVMFNTLILFLKNVKRVPAPVVHLQPIHGVHTRALKTTARRRLHPLLHSTEVTGRQLRHQRPLWTGPPCTTTLTTQETQHQTKSSVWATLTGDEHYLHCISKLRSLTFLTAFFFQYRNGLLSTAPPPSFFFNPWLFDRLLFRPFSIIPRAGTFHCVVRSFVHFPRGSALTNQTLPIKLESAATVYRSSLACLSLVFVLIIR